MNANAGTVFSQKKTKVMKFENPFQSWFSSLSSVKDFCGNLVNSRDLQAGVDCCMRFGFPILLGLILMAAYASPGQTSSGVETGIEGIITITPTQPGPVRADSPSSKPLAKATFAVENEKGEVASFTTDDQGHFRTTVPPGHYKVSMKERKSSIGRFGPFEVDVVAGKITKVDWQCDSGIR
jgi:hypothetical protein